MADYWVSRDKYYCKYCKIYIADDKPSRIQHETGLRHKGNYERYIRDIYKRGARDQKDKVEEAKEIARIDAAAKAAMGIIDEEPSQPVASTSKATPAPPTAPKPSDPYANYSTAEFLGYKDDAAEKKKEEKELRKKEGLIGEWQKVAKRPPPPPPLTQPAVPTGGLLPIATPLGGGASIPKQEEGVKNEEGGEDSNPTKPALSSNLDEEQAEQRRKAYFTEKSYNPDEDDFDPSKISSGQIKLKRKRLTLKEEVALEKERREREEALVPIVGIAERRPGGTGGGWATAEIEEEPLLDFEEEKPQVKAEAEEKPATTTKSEGGSGGGTGFKKRKMHGSGTVRKK